MGGGGHGRVSDNIVIEGLSNVQNAGGSDAERFEG